MFRMAAPRLDAAEEKRRAMEEDKLARKIVYSNFGTFVVTIMLIKAGERPLSGLFSAWEIRVSSYR